MKRALTTAALVAAVAVFGLLTLAPARVSLASRFDDGSVPGAMHIHSNRSDGRGSVEEIAAAAARAGLKFIVLTDHGDGTRPADPPAYRSGVLCIDAVEISTTGGHYIALGLPKAPYPLGGEPRDVVEDVKRLGGFGIAAHPDSPKPELQWRGWDTGFDGMELLNADSGWRRAAASGLRAKALLASRLLTYPIRPAETIASFIADPADSLARWDARAATREVVGVAGADAHARLALGSSEPAEGRWSLPGPGYETSFRTMTVHVTPVGKLTGDPTADATRILDGIRGGHVYIAVDGLATGAAFTFTAQRGSTTLQAGDTMPRDGVTLRVHSNAPAGFTTSILHNGRAIASSANGEVSATPSGAGAYRAEIVAARTGNPVWILSNPIYVNRGPITVTMSLSEAAEPHPIFDGQNFGDWNVEHDPGSMAAIERASVEGEGALGFRYTLAPSGQAHPYAAILRDLTDGVYGSTEVEFMARADKPMRLSVQLRTGGNRTPQERWQRSVYLDTTERPIGVPFNQLTPALDTTTREPRLGAIGYILFVVDQTNTKPGTSGEVWLRQIDLAQDRPIRPVPATSAR